ncbi:TatD family hydrolase [Insolitispirillum peregrinum]|uniref:TatD DNase family protein n=1 Tax=Insolitispirillum peregrinum TaxID=80876 RepID=A0A1N7IWL0_9PROT|nr:TatD family hydrolase [Insolitispirillum peregrinum]SIS41492.1 TatD DNase family protein [Insolitispirillum peregrinum]
MFLVDSHCHLDFPDFAAELDDVIARSRDAGVQMMLTICTHLSKFEQVRAVAEAYPEVYCTVGIHPHEAANEPEVDAETLMRLAEHPKVVGFGETGLDFYYEHSPRAEQERSFRAHIAAARTAQLPIIIHTRNADDDTLRILDDEMEKGAFPGLIHCFSSSHQVAERAVEHGMYISFSGIATFKKAEEIRGSARMLPLDRLLVETDAPYLAPIPHRGKRNEPAFTRHTAACLAKELGLSEQAFAEATSRNFFTLFKKVPSPF